MVSETFSEFIKNISAEDACKEILEQARRDKDSVLVDFKMNKGKMSGVGEFNTWIRFDLQNSPLLKKVLKRLVEANDPNEEEIKLFEEWRKSVSSNIIDKMQDQIKEIVCESTFSGNKDIPFKLMSADFELTDLPDNDKVVVIRKASPPGIVTPPVSSEIMRIFEETGESFENIVNRKKSEGDPRYRWIVGVDSRKSFFEATLSIAVDYSLQEDKENKG